MKVVVANRTDETLTMKKTTDSGSGVTGTWEDASNTVIAAQGDAPQQKVQYASRYMQVDGIHQYFHALIDYW